MKNIECKVDALDMKILNIISKDARIPFRNVAELCGVSRAAIHLRVQHLIDMGIISDLPERVKKNLGATKGKIIDTLVTSIITTSYNKPQIKMDDAVYDEMVYFREFAFNEIYLSKKLMAENEKAEHIIEHLFEYYMKHPWEIKDVSDSSNLERSVIDYIAGMTDQYAIKVYKDLYIPLVWKVV